MIKVVIVEDEDIIRKALIYTFDWMSLGCTVAGEAADGSDGLELIRRVKPDIVLSDIKMENMDGITMLREARGFCPFQIILLTSYSDFSWAQQAISLGAVDYILKPIDENKLAAAVRKACRLIAEQQEYLQLKTIQQQDIPLDRHTDPMDYLEQCHDFYVRQTLQIMSEHYYERLSIESIADSLSISTSYLSRKFKSETSETFGTVLSRYRIHKAIEMMEAGNYRIYEIAEKAGFTDYKHFCTVFKRYLRISPTEFKRKNYSWRKPDERSQS